jgi:hypothetical protein
VKSGDNVLFPREDGVMLVAINTLKLKMELCPMEEYTAPRAP